MIVLIWCTLTAAMLALYNEHQQGLLLGQIQAELRERTDAQVLAEHANTAKDGFMAYLSHEIRNPLSVIMGSIDMIADPALSDRTEKYLDALQTASDSLVNLLDDVSDFSSLEGNRLDLQVARFELSLLLTELHREFEHRAHRKGLLLTINSSRGVWLDTDRARLKQVLSNLLINAIKFTTHGEATLEMEILEREGADIVRLSVTDTGRGISESELERIFDPFEREGAKDSPGIGLGLAICKGIVDKMGSSISVHSRLGRGSMFFFDLPRSIPHVQEQKALTRQPISSFNDLRVLVVEDNEHIASLYTEHCLGMGCQVAYSYDGFAGLELARTWKPNVILLDLDLPEISGQEIIDRLYSDDAPVQIVVITGSTFSLQNLPVFKALHKPVSLQTVHRVLEEALLAG